MSKQIIELAIRTRNPAIDEESFLQMKDTAVHSLVSINGVGPEREFDPLRNIPEQSGKVYIGMTRYNSMGRVIGASFNFRFIGNLIKFLKMCDVISGVFIKPEDESFDYVNFTSKDNITEIALLRPKGIGKAQFLQERTKYLASLNQEKEVVNSYTFKTKWGFKNTDVLVHFTVYKNLAAYNKLTKRASGLSYMNDFNSKTTPLIISYSTTIK